MPTARGRGLIRQAAAFAGDRDDRVADRACALSITWSRNSAQPTGISRPSSARIAAERANAARRSAGVAVEAVSRAAPLASAVMGRSFRSEGLFVESRAPSHSVNRPYMETPLF